MFPGLPFPNADTLTATVPATLPVGTAVTYSCTGANLAVNGIQSNMCDMNGMYIERAPSCQPDKLILIVLLSDIIGMLSSS